MTIAVAVPVAAPTRPFAAYETEAWPYRFEGTIQVPTIAGGTPTDPHVAEGWIRSKLADTDDILRALVAKTMADRGVTADEAAGIVDQQKHLNGFKRLRCPDCPPDGPFCDTGLHDLVIEGRHLKACIKEAASVAVGSDKLKGRGWGKTNKGLLGFIAEHVFVVEDYLPIGVYNEPTGIMQRFVHTFRGDAIQYEEFVEDAKFDFSIRTDYEFSEQEWAMIWLTAEQEGIGASRSQGFGRFELVRWERVR